MNLFELHNSRRDLDWSDEGAGIFTAEFEATELRYGIIVQTETVDGFTFGRVDFHVKTEDGRLRHDSVNIGSGAFEVLGIVVNGVRERFADLDGYFFVAKRSLYPEEFEKRVKIYGRMAHKLHVENSMHLGSIKRPDEHAFVLTYQELAMTTLKSLLGDDLGQQ